MTEISKEAREAAENEIQNWFSPLGNRALGFYVQAALSSVKEAQPKPTTIGDEVKRVFTPEVRAELGELRSEAPTTQEQPPVLDERPHSGQEHNLKTWPEYYTAIISGIKRFEIRRNDRDFHTGDILILHEFTPAVGFSGRSIRVGVDYIIYGPAFGIEDGFCVMQLAPLTDSGSGVAEVKCAVCDWTNVGLLNVGNFGEPKWVCHGCIKRRFDSAPTDEEVKE